VGTAAKLAFTTSPSGSTAGAPFATQPVVAVQDAGGNTVTTDTSSVTLAITSGTGTTGAVLSGCAPSRVNGVTSFTGGKVDKVGAGYPLPATDGGLASAVSSSFNITAGTVAQFGVSAPASVTAGSSFTVTLTAQDAGGNTVTSYAGVHTIVWSG